MLVKCEFEERNKNSNWVYLSSGFFAKPESGLGRKFNPLFSSMPEGLTTPETVRAPVWLLFGGDSSALFHCSLPGEVTVPKPSVL